MKKLFLSILTVAVLASCSKSDLAYTEQDSEIMLAPVTSMATKVNGSIDGTKYPEAENFIVTAFWINNGGVTNTTPYLDEKVFTKKAGNQYWSGVSSYYWPKNGSLKFTCYSPASIIVNNDVKYTLADNCYTVDYTQSSNTGTTVDFMLTDMSAPYTALTPEDKVSVVFKHALSWITIKVKGADDVAATAFTIHDVIINDVNTKGLLNAVMDNGISYDEWSAQNTAVAYDVVKDKNINLSTVATIVEDADKGTVVIPQVPTTLTINYTQNSINGSAVLNNQTITIPLTVAANKWEPGKHYIYTVTFGLDEILINPSVTKWEDQGVNKEVGKLY